VEITLPLKSGMIRQLPRRPQQFSDLFEEYGSGSIVRLPAHRNGGFELHYIAEGHLHWEIEGRPFLVPPRSVFFTFPWEKHGSCVDFEPGHFFHFVVFRLQNPRADDLNKMRLVKSFGLPESEQQQIFSKLAATRNRCLAASPDLAWLIARLTRELTQPGMMARTNVIALSRTVLCELIKNLRPSKIKTKNDSASERQVLRFADRLRLQCAKPWTLQTMASACGLKRTQFEKLTKELTGDTPRLLLNRFRVRSAQQFLKGGDESITEIALNTGFGSSQYFSKIFKNLTGITPSQYRHGRGSLATYDQRFLKALEKLRG